ncbi:MAG TPA: RsmE family RNA methyltransferase [Symbiobacteriaceae bacterium]
MTRFFVERVEGDRVRLDKEDSHHLLRVLRARVGEPFTVLCGGMEYHCRLVGHHEGYAHGEVVETRPATGEPAVHITLFQGLAKGDKLETVIQQGTQLGINEFVPVVTSRSVVKLEPRKAAERVQRWRRIAREAAAQSRRGAVPHVRDVEHWHHVVTQSRHYDLALVPWEEGGEPLRSVLADVPAPRRIAIFIGPEGGFAPEEISLAREHGARPVTLGPRILRTELAGLVAAAVTLFTLGELG